MRTFLILLVIVALAIITKEAFSAEKPILVIALYNGAGIPEGWLDSTTRPEATDICVKMIATQSKLYANAISRSRCIIQVQE